MNIMAKATKTVTKATATLKKVGTKVKAVITEDYTTYPLADREAMFLADLAKLNQKYNIGLSIALIDLSKRDLPTIQA